MISRFTCVHEGDLNVCVMGTGNLQKKLEVNTELTMYGKTPRSEISPPTIRPAGLRLEESSDFGISSVTVLL